LSEKSWKKILEGKKINAILLTCISRVICLQKNTSVFFTLDMSIAKQIKKRVYQSQITKPCTCIVKIDCLFQYVQNGLSYLGKETRPKLCLKRRQANSGISSLGRNKDQLLHRIQSVRTFTNLQYMYFQIFVFNIFFQNKVM